MTKYQVLPFGSRPTAMATSVVTAQERHFEAMFYSPPYVLTCENIAWTTAQGVFRASGLDPASRNSRSMACRARFSLDGIKWV